MNRDLRLDGRRQRRAARCCWCGASPSSFRLVVLRRLQRFETTARQIAAGDLDRRVPGEGSDTISWLAREFNTMADSVTGLVGEVRSQRERLETIINSIDDGIVVLDATRHVIAANEAFLQRTGGHRDAGARVLLPGSRRPAMCNVGGLPDHRLPGVRRAPGPHLRAPHAGRQRGLGGGARLADPRRGRPRRARRRGLARHLRPARRRGAAGRVAPARLAGPAGLGLLPRAEHAARHGADLRRGHPARRRRADRRRGRHRAASARAPSIARDQVLRCRGITQHFLRMSRGQTSPGDIVDLGRRRWPRWPG